MPEAPALVPGLWTLLLVEIDDADDAVVALRRAWRRLTGRRAAGSRVLETVRHSVLDRGYIVTVCQVDGLCPALPARARQAPDRPHDEGPPSKVPSTRP